MKNVLLSIFKKSFNKKVIASIIFVSLLSVTILGTIFYLDNTRTFTPNVSKKAGTIYNKYSSNEMESASCYSLTDNCTDTSGCLPYDIPTTSATISKQVENDFITTKDNKISTFSSDIDTASYITFRQLINNGNSTFDIRNQIFRTEEMVNYFNYTYNEPTNNEVFGVTTEVGTCPWNPENSLVKIGIKAKDINISKRAPLNLVFLIDVSGSMFSEDKLPLLKQAFAALIKNLNNKDRISIVTYANGTDVLLNGVKGSHKKYIMNKINSLEAGGGTNGGEGLKLAYKVAMKHFNKKGNNRIILATDGDLNIGMTSTEELKDYISKEKNKGVFLSVLGFGNYHYNDSIMETLADNGNGNYSIIDNLSDAKKVLSNEFMGTMYTVAKDVKFQMEFNPDYVNSYRLIGYENRIMDAKDFENDKKDAGDMGAGQALTILYEINTSESTSDYLKLSNTKASNSISQNNTTSNSQNNATSNTQNDSNLNLNNAMKLDIRYKEPTSNKSQLISHNISSTHNEKLSNDFIFISSVVETAMLLNQSKYLGTTSINTIKDQLNSITLSKDKQEFKTLIDTLALNNKKY